MHASETLQASLPATVWWWTTGKKIQWKIWLIREHRASCPTPESLRNCSSWSRSQRRELGGCSYFSLLICQGMWSCVNVVNNHVACHHQIACNIFGSICYFWYLGQRLTLLWSQRNSPNTAKLWATLLLKQVGRSHLLRKQKAVARKSKRGCQEMGLSSNK